MPETVVFDVAGASGLNIQSGIVREEFLQELTGPQGIKRYKQMSSNDPVIGGMLFAIKMLARTAEWRVEPGGETPADQEAADFIWGALNDMETPWPDTVFEMMTMLEFGWSLFEKVFKLRKGPEEQDAKFLSKFTDNRVAWRGYELRAQDSLIRWDQDTDNSVIGMIQSAPPDFIERNVPLEKSLLFRTSRTKNNPEGRSILRTAYVPWFRKNVIEQVEGIGIERDLAGLPVMYVPNEIMGPNANAGQKALYDYCKRIVENIRNDEQAGVILPAMFDDTGRQRRFELTLLNSQGRRNFDTNAIVTRYDQRIAMSAMADFILIGHESVGSFALSSSKTKMFSISVGAYLDIIADEINKNAIPEILLLNGMNVEAPPVLKPGDVETIDLTDLGSFVARLAGAGMAMFPDEKLEAYFRKQMGAPQVRGLEAVSLFEMQNGGPSENGDGEAPQTVDRQGRVRGPRSLMAGGEN